MTVLVEDALHLGALVHGKVVAGRGGLHNVIEHVSVLEVPPPISQWLRGGEMILTTFYCVKDQPERQAETIRALRQAGSSALVFHPGHANVVLTREALAEADAASLPIITVPIEMAYADIMTPLLGAIWNRHTVLLQRAHDIHQRLTALLLCGAGLQDICITLSHLLQRAVLIVDTSGRSLAGSSVGDTTIGQPPGVLPATPEVFERLARKVQHGQVHEQHDAASGAVAVPISTGRSVRGMMVALAADRRPPDPTDMVALEQAALVVALKLAKEEAIREAESRLHSDFLESLLGGAPHGSNRALTALNITHKHVAVLLDLGKMATYQVFHGEALNPHGAENGMLDVVRRVVLDQAWNSIVVQRDGHLVLLPELEGPFNRGRIRQEVGALVVKIERALAGAIPHAPIATCGGIYQEANLKRSYGEAVRALEIRKTVNLAHGLVWYDDVRFFDLLLRSGDEYDLRAFCEATITPLLHYDEKGSKLTETLEAYLDSGMRLQETAARLYLHPNAVKYRLSRIRDILGIDPFSPTHHLTYHIATKLVRLLTSALCP